jgi:hypothetical protein
VRWYIVGGRGKRQDASVFVPDTGTRIKLITRDRGLVFRRLSLAARPQLGVTSLRPPSSDAVGSGSPLL